MVGINWEFAVELEKTQNTCVLYCTFLSNLGVVSGVLSGERGDLLQPSFGTDYLDKENMFG